MNFIYNFIPEELAKAIGWTIFHSIWQSALVAIILGASLLIAGKKSARLRYYFSFVSLVVIFILSVSTFTKAYNPSRTNIEFNTISVNDDFNFENSNSNSQNLSTANSTDLIGVLKSTFAQNLSLIVTAWFMGFLIFSLRFLGGLLYVQRLKKHGVNPLDDFWNYRMRELSSSLKINKPVKIFESIRVKVPLTIGYLKPIILVPLGMMSGLPQDQIEAIIIHELAHIKRYDFILNLLQTFIETIFFFNPIVWWISSIVKNERENCCDDLTLNLCGGSLVYFKALYNLQQICSEDNELVLAAVGKRNQLFRRINRMNSNNRNTSYGIKFAAFASTLVIVALVSFYTTSDAKVDTNKKFRTAAFVNPFVSLKESTPHIVPPADLTASQDTTSIKKGKRTLKYNDDDKRFKVKLNNGKIEELYIDGEKVADKDIPNYETQVLKHVDEYDSAMKEFNSNMKNFKAEMKQFKEKMKNFKYNYSYDHDFDFDLHLLPHIEIDSLINKKVLKELQLNLKKNFAKHSFHVPPVHIPPINIPPIKIPRIHVDSLNWGEAGFDTASFKKSMKEWGENFKKEMENWKKNNEGFKKEMEKFNEEMKKSKFNNEEFKKSMESLKENMSKLKADMKILKEYLKDVKSELVKDNLIDEDDDLDGFYLSKTEMKVNGEKVSPELHKKYLEIYKKHYGKELKDDQKINFND